MIQLENDLSLVLQTLGEKMAICFYHKKRQNVIMKSYHSSIFLKSNMNRQKNKLNSVDGHKYDAVKHQQQ